MFVILVIVDCIWQKPVSTYAISVLIGGFGEKIIMCTLQDRKSQKTKKRNVSQDKTLSITVTQHVGAQIACNASVTCSCFTVFTPLNL